MISVRNISMRDKDPITEFILNNRKKVVLTVDKTGRVIVHSLY